MSVEFRPEQRVTQGTGSTADACATTDAHPAAQELLSGKGRIFIVMGAPAAGKGTQCKLLAKKLGFVHLSTGDVFRDLAARGTELGLRAKEFIDKRCFVPDDMVLSLVRERLSQPDVKEHGCLLDGFPRTADQVEALLDHIKVDGVFYLQAPEKTLIRRAADRRIDPETGAIYHLKYLPPPSDVSSRLVRRDLDDEHSFRQRLEVFKGESRRVLPYFSGQVHKIDATLEPDEVNQGMVRSLEKILGKNSGSADNATNTAQPEHACAICFDEPADFLVVPCGHQCGCEQCLIAVQQHSGRCPICRNHVQGIQRVFRCGRGVEEDADASQIGNTRRSSTPHADLQEKLDEQAGVTDKVKEEEDDDDDEWSDDGDAEEQQQDSVSCVVAPCEDVGEGGGAVHVMVSARIPDMMAKAPTDICCVIDISGSMGSLATYEGEDGKVKNDGLTVLDIVKHATKTVIKSLDEGDRLALVAFNDKARTALTLTQMDADGQSKALEALDGLHPNAQTNIWAGVLAAMDALREGNVANSGRQQAVLLLTDGQPNIVPPRGHLPELRDYKDTHPGFTFQLNTFGFGYNLDSELLLQLATEGNGTLAFIPDAVIVGTTFVNSVANVRSTLAQSATVNLMPRGGAKFSGPTMGEYSVLSESWGRAVNLGPLQYGQSRELVVPMHLPPSAAAGATATDEVYLEVVLTYPRASGSPGHVTFAATDRKSSPEAVLARCRADTVGTGYSAIAKAAKNEGKKAGADVAGLQKRVEACAHPAASSTAGEGQHEDDEQVDGRLKALLADVGGRMSKALQGKERFNRWGKHYLRALMRAHQLQACTNFMDPGLQPYGGSLFRSLREAGDQIFLALPPPQASSKQTGATTRRPSTASARASSPASPRMNTYYAGAGGGCFAPSCCVRRVVCVQGMDEEMEVTICSLRKGDVLCVAGGGVAKVQCLVQVARPASKPLVALPNGPLITPGHPVLVGGIWQLPRDLPDAVHVANEEGYVYNVVLDRCHILPVNGVDCVTWGHGLEGDVISHPFFGTDRVFQDLQAFEGWERGFVRVDGTFRDAAGEVAGFWGPGHAGFASKAKHVEEVRQLMSSL